MYELKRVTSVCLIFFIGLFLFMGTAFAVNPTNSPTDSPTEAPTDSPTEEPAEAPDSAITLKDYTGNVTYTGTVGPDAVMLLDGDSKTILYQKNIDEQVGPASTTKIMTCILALESEKLDETVTVSSKAANMKGSLLHIYNGEKIVLKDLINGMMMLSGNDAAVAVAEFLGGDIDGFAQKMNDKAAALGMTKTHFSVPHGMDTENHYTTASDMALLTVYAMQNPQFVQIVSQKSYTMPADNHYHSSRTVDNTNHLLDTEDPNYYQYATGVKTGSTPKGGDCLVASATKTGANNNKMNLICLIYKDKYNGSARWPLAKDLFEWGFDNFETVKLSELLSKTKPVQIQVQDYAADDSSNGVLEFAAPDADKILVTFPKSTIEGIKNSSDSVETSQKLKEETIKAPVEKNDILGEVTYKIKATGEEIYTQKLIAPRAVLEAGSLSSDGQTPVTMMPVTSPSKVPTTSDNGFIYLFLIIPAGLIVFLVIRLMTSRRGKMRFKKRHRPHYSYRIK
jgi:serine-type D-Ala-D-Ala carboxypeptidase (penicillin-binding protein 5/6)